MIFSSFMNDEAGGTAIEYSLIAVAIAVAIIMAVANLGGQVLSMFVAVAAGLD